MRCTPILVVTLSLATFVAVTEANPLPGQVPSPRTRQTRRYLRLENQTGVRTTVFLQYHTWTRRRTWEWFPGPPGTEKAVVYTLAPGQRLNLRHENWPVSASKVRIWARTVAGHQLLDFKSEDLWLVEQTGGERCYYANRPETFTFTLLAPEPEKGERAP